MAVGKATHGACQSHLVILKHRSWDLRRTRVSLRNHVTEQVFQNWKLNDHLESEWRAEDSPTWVLLNVLVGRGNLHVLSTYSKKQAFGFHTFLTTVFGGKSYLHSTGDEMENQWPRWLSKVRAANVWLQVRWACFQSSLIPHLNSRVPHEAIDIRTIL